MRSQCKCDQYEYVSAIVVCVGMGDEIDLLSRYD